MTNPHADANIKAKIDAENDAFVEGDVDLKFLKDTVKLDFFDLPFVSSLASFHENETIFDTDQLLGGKTQDTFQINSFLSGTV